MGDYIKREDALYFMNAQREQIKKQMDEALVYELFHTRSDLKCALLQLEGDIFLLESMSAADVAPVVHGKWCHENDDDWCGGGKTMCSACGYGFSDGAYHEVLEFKFCPACGANMEAQDG